MPRHSIFFVFYHFSVFFCEDIASERGAGSEILQGTALRMPKSPDYESFKRIIDKVECSEGMYYASLGAQPLCCMSLYLLSLSSLSLSSQSLFTFSLSLLLSFFSYCTSRYIFSLLPSLHLSSTFALCILPSIFLFLFSFHLQLPDTDAPYVFCLPDNIERSLQRVTSAGVIRQLRALSTLDAEASKFDREKWRSQVSWLRDVHTIELKFLILTRF